jgi:Resolvase, N terminal domain
MGAIVGYARTSTSEQVAGLEAQERDLRAAGVTKLYSEQVSSIAHREALQQALDYIREDDVFIVTKLDRLARSVADLLTIQEIIERKGASLRILALNLDTTTPTGKLMLNLLGSIAQFERELDLAMEPLARLQRLWPRGACAGLAVALALNRDGPACPRLRLLDFGVYQSRPVPFRKLL